MSRVDHAVPFYEKEQKCEHLFRSERPFWHLYTDGSKTDMLFADTEEFIIGINGLGMCASRFPDVHIYTFTLMNDHLHMILSGLRERCKAFFDAYKKYIKSVFRRNARTKNLKGFCCELLEITDLRMLRNEIVYVNRNGYLVHPEHTPFTYPWGCGPYMFNPTYKAVPCQHFNSLSLRERRKISRSREATADDAIMVINGMLLPPSFCYTKKAESMFRDAHHYFNMLSKKFEAYNEIAKRLHEKVFIADEEMYSAISALCVKEFNIRKPSDLAPKEKIEIARKMHFEYNASGRQIRSILKLEQHIVDEMFPTR